MLRPYQRFVAAALACAAVEALAAEPVQERPRTALVLSGGGARGLAHIGVLKVLRDAKIPVDFVVATSMGAIVGGAFVAGRSPEDMESLVVSADWDRIFSDRPPREDLSFRRKEDDLRFIGRGELGIKKDGLVLPRGALGSHNLEEFLRGIVRPASDTRRLDQFPIPLYAVATNLETGQIVVLHEVALWIAMRSSMSIPGVFAPAEVDGRILGDGGLVRNLPVEIARQHGAEVIIAVNVGTPLLPRESLSSALGVAQQMINILTEQNVESSLKALGPQDILVSPDLKGVTFLDFERGADLIARGEAAARAALPALAKLAVSERAYEAWEFARTRQPVYWDRAIEDIRVVGTKRSNPEALVREVERLGIVKGETVNDDQLVHAARVISGMGEYERVDVHAEIEGADQDPRARKFVVIDVDEKPWGPNYLRIGGRAVADFQTDARFSITLQHTRTWLNDWGAEWRNEVSIGDVRRFATSAYQPLGPGSAWFIEGMLQAVRSDFDIYAVSTGLTSQRTDRVTRSLNGAYATLGRRFGTAGVARLMFGHERYGTRPLVGTTAVATRDEGKLVLVDATYDTLDDANFPRYGFLGTAALTSISYASGGDPVEGSILQALLPITFGRLTLLALASGAYSRDDRGQFSLGGLFSLSGTPIGRVSGSQVVGLSGLAYYRVGDLPRTLGRGWYVGGSIEAGNAWAHRSDVSARDVHKAASVFVGFDTIIGPLYLAAGKTLHGQSALYLFLGRPTDRN